MIAFSEGRCSTTQTRTFTYDKATLRLMSVNHPESGSVTYTYNSNGTLATKVDAKNQKMEYVYDSYNRVTPALRRLNDQDIPPDNGKR